ncbi:MAG: nitrogenase component 1 [Myxococcota bacterium]|nr:nitrogenase component 1 [Myxococcota bacterium]
MSVEELEHFRLKSMDQGQFTGTFIAVHAVRDGFLMMHCGVGCKHKATSQLSEHDLGRSAEHEGWTEVGDAELIEGSAHRIGPYLRSWYDRMKPGLIIANSVTFLDLTGDDLRHEVEKAAKGIPCPVHFVKVPGYEGDLFSGYAAVVLAVARGLDWSGDPGPKTAVTIAGHFFDRYEGDQAGNLAQLGTLLKSIGCTLQSTLFGGSRYADLVRAPEAGTVLAFPVIHPQLRRLKRWTKREPVVVDLPMGLDGTSAWLRTVGRATGADSERVERVIAAQRERTLQRLRPSNVLLNGLRVAVMCDLPHAVGVLHVLRDLGCTPAVVGLRGHTLGGEAELRAAAERTGLVIDPGLVILENPSIHRVRTEVQRRLEGGRLDAIIGSSTDINAIATLEPTTAIHIDHGGAWTGSGPKVVEFGFPCRNYHVVRASPTFGFAGVLGWADRLVNAPRLWDTWRNQPT